ncbi:MAG TPA: hypothetical protein VK968_04595, partial [Roseimicrobium sp.]|nr:hypothetical protein [Roseimicrobium sp.]
MERSFPVAFLKPSIAGAGPAVSAPKVSNVETRKTALVRENVEVVMGFRRFYQQVDPCASAKRCVEGQHISRAPLATAPSDGLRCAPMRLLDRYLLRELLIP